MLVSFIPVLSQRCRKPLGPKGRRFGKPPPIQSRREFTYNSLGNRCCEFCGLPISSALCPIVDKERSAVRRHVSEWLHGGTIGVVQELATLQKAQLLPTM